MSRPFPCAFDPRSVITVPLTELCLLDLKSVTDTEVSCVTPSSSATSEGRDQAPARLRHRTASGKGPISVNLFFGQGLNGFESSIPLARMASERRETGETCG